MEASTSFDGIDVPVMALKTPTDSLKSFMSLLEQDLSHFDPGSAGDDLDRIPSIPNEEDRAEFESMLRPEVLAEWDYDIFRLKHLSGGHCLIHMADAAVASYGLLEALQIPRKKFIRLINAIEMGYNSCLYHNKTHAADVLHATHCFLIENDLYKKMPWEDVLALLLGSALHDIGHPGVGNHFLVTIDHPATKRYGRSSILEQYHIEYALRLLEAPGCEILKHMETAKSERVKTLIRLLIMDTDMAVHSKLEQAIKAVAHCHHTTPPLPAQQQDSKEDAVVAPLDPNCQESTILLRAILHAADLSSLCKVWEIHIQWSHAVIAEFCSQGDLESEMGLPVSSHCVRDLSQGRTSQKNFIVNFVIPLYEHCRNAFPSLANLCERSIKQMKSNVSKWEGLGY